MKQMIMIFSMVMWASWAGADLKVFDGKSYQPLKVQEFQQLKLSMNCFKGKTPQCEAWKASRKRVARTNLPQALGGNPAARYCLDAGGENRIAKTDAGQEYDYCLFKDGSLVESWGLYNKFNPISVRK